MLNQMAGLAHIPAASLEEIREKRLAYFTTTHQREPGMSPSEAKSLQTREKPGKIPVTQLNINNSHSENDDDTQKRHSVSARGSQADKMSNYLSSDSVALADKLPQRHHDVETMGSPHPKGCLDHHSHVDQELLLARHQHTFVDNQQHMFGERQQPMFGERQQPMFVDKQQHMFGGLSTKDPHLQVEIGQRSIDPTPNSGFASTGDGENLQGIFSEKIAEEIRSVLGEEGLQNIMIKVARDLKQLNGGRPGPHINDVNGEESDSTFEVTDRNRRSSSSSLVQSLAMKNKDYSDLSSIKPMESGSSSLMSSTITRNLQQLKEGENAMLARNYDQITVPTVTKNSFSSEEIYRQAFGGHFVHSDKQHNVHTYPEPATCHWQNRQAFLQNSRERSGCPNYGDHVRSPISHFSPPINQNNIFSFPPPHPHLHFDPHFNNMLSLSPNSPGSPTSQYVFQNGTQPFYSQQYISTTNHLPLQHCQDLNQIYTGYKSSLPIHTSTAFGQSTGPYFYPPSIYPDPRRGAVFINRIPVHLPPPSFPQYVKQHSNHLQQPQLPASPRREDSTQPGSSHPQVLPDFLLAGPFVRAPRPPVVPPALQPRIDSHVILHRFEHRGMPDGSCNASPKHQLENGSSEKYILQRYFSSLEVYNDKALDAGEDVTVAPSDRLEGGPDVTKNKEGTAFSIDAETATNVTETGTDVTKTSTAKLGGLTQRLQDLDVDLDHLKHLRLVDEAKDHPQASGNAELFSKRIKQCPECGGSNKAYMDWCVYCGEVLIGIEPTFHKENNQLSNSQQKKKAMKTLSSNRGINCLHGSKSKGTSTECEERSNRRINCLHGSKSKGTSTDKEDKEYSGSRSLESHGDLSPSDFPVQDQLVEMTFTRSRDKRRAYDSPLQKRNIRQPLQERAYEEDTGLIEDDTEDGVSDVANIDLNADNMLLEEIEDPLIREFAVSYRKRQLLQQMRNSDQIAHKTFNKHSGKSRFSANSVNMEDADISVAATFVVATSIAATSVVATSNAATSHAAGASVVATFGPARPGTYVPGAVKIFTSAAGKKDALDTGQKLSCHVGVSAPTSDFTSADPGPRLWSSAPQRGQATNGAVLQPLVAHVENIQDGNIEPSTVQHQSNKNSDLQVLHEERKVMKKRKKRKKIRGENVDIEIFAYNETRKSSSQPTSRVVPVLNLTCSSDDEEDDDDDDDEYDSEEIEAETINDDVNECLTSSDFDRQMDISNPAELQTCNKPQLTRNHQNVELTNSSQSHPMKAIHTSPLQPSFSKSGASFHRQKNRGSVISGPARYQRHWARSSIAWSSYNPRELTTRSSLGNSQSITRRGAGRTPVLTRLGRSEQEVGGDAVTPAQRRPSSAGCQRRQPASELHQRPSSAKVSQRPSSAKVSHTREKPQVQRPATSHRDSFEADQQTVTSHGDSFEADQQTVTSHGDSFETHQAITLQEDGFKTYPPPASHGDGFKAHPPSASHGDGFKAHPPSASQGGVSQTSPPTISHRDGLQTYPPSTPQRDGLQTYPPTTPHRDGHQAGRKDRHTGISSIQEEEASVPQISRHTKPSIARSIPRKASSPQATGPSQPHNGEVISDKDSPRLLCAELHRLPHKDVGEEHSGRLQAMATSAYDKLQEMTPRINQGEASVWECLPDEIWLHIFSFLTRRDLINVMGTLKYFNKLANDQTLWKYITVTPKYPMTDFILATIAQRRPVSLAMVKCQGTQATTEGLHHFFRETQDRLKELNICGCSQGSLVGTVVLQVAALYCRRLTHLDASFCNVTDSALLAMFECAERFESVCLNGFQSLRDSSLLVLLRKHGQSLRTLELYACFSLNVPVFLSIGLLCPNLHRLCLGSCEKLTDAVMTNVSTYLPHIEELDLRGCKHLSDDCINVLVYNCPLVRTLVLANCHRISNAALTVIAARLNNTLRVLDVCGCNRVTDEGVASLTRNCGQLTNLDISSTKCTGVSVQILADSSCNKHLVAVKFSFLSGLTETCLSDFIRQCPRLKTVHVYGCSPLKNVARLQSTNLEVSIEGDSSMFKC